MPVNAQPFDVLIIGAGLSGIGQAGQVRAALPEQEQQRHQPRTSGGRSCPISA
jgi:cation diffusion facilitator CzcD-associated flavoprotein CzcO